MEQMNKSKKKKKKSIFGMTFMGDFTVQGNMFDIHDNQNVYFNGEKDGKDEEDDEEEERENIPTSLKADKNTIIDYVMRLDPVINEQFKKVYKRLWLKILDLDEVKSIVYDRGRQKGTNFNRNFVACIIHLMAADHVLLEGTKVVQIAELLEPNKGKTHPIRNSLGVSPEKNLKKAIESIFTEYGVKVL